MEIVLEKDIVLLNNETEEFKSWINYGFKEIEFSEKHNTMWMMKKSEWELGRLFRKREWGHLIHVSTRDDLIAVAFRRNPTAMM
jgi:hypothetical protein